MNTRIYVAAVEFAHTDDLASVDVFSSGSTAIVKYHRDRLVEAGSQAQVTNHIVKGGVKVRVATQADLVRLLSEGVKVEKASEE